MACISDVDYVGELVADETTGLMCVASVVRSNPAEAVDTNLDNPLQNFQTLSAQFRKFMAELHTFLSSS